MHRADQVGRTHATAVVRRRPRWTGPVAAPATRWIPLALRSAASVPVGSRSGAARPRPAPEAAPPGRDPALAPPGVDAGEDAAPAVEPHDPPCATSGLAGALTLHRAYEALVDAALAPDPARRYCAAHLAALQCAAVVLAARSGTGGSAPRPRRPWPLLAEVAPELGAWASFFALGDVTYQALRRGGDQIVSAREADQFFHDVGRFTGVVAHWLNTRARSAGVAVRWGSTPSSAG